MEMASNLSSSFRLPELSWPNRQSFSEASEAAAGMMPMPVSLSRAFSGSREADEEGGGGGEADWGIAGQPCPLCASLTMKERIGGFAICFACGIFFSVAAFGSWSSLFVGRPEKFAITYTLGNLFNIASTLFLVGPGRQCRSMWKSTRRIASLVYITCIVLTLACVVFRWHKYHLSLLGAILTFSFVGIQSVALLYYGLSYVPFGRSIFGRAVTNTRSWIMS